MKGDQEFTWIGSGPLKFLSLPDLPAGVFAGFTGRLDGISEPPFDSLDLAFHVGDNYQAVNENWNTTLSAIRDLIGMEIVFTRLVHQEHTGRIDNFSQAPKIVKKDSFHSSRINDQGVASKQSAAKNQNASFTQGAQIDNSFIIQKKDPCDAQFTALRNIAIAVLTADCVPILIFDDDATVIAAVHAGWKGTSKRILERTIKRIEQKCAISPKKLSVWIGPSIGQCCFEVGNDIADRFRRMLRSSGDIAAETVRGRPAGSPGSVHLKYINNVSGRSFIDLKNFNRLQALSSGVQPGKITSSDICTSCRNDLFFSYRKEKITGRQAAIITLF